MESCRPVHLLAITATRFPQGEAAANRLFHLARAVCHGGGQVTVVNDLSAVAPHPAGPPGAHRITVVELGRPVRSRLLRRLLRAVRPFRILLALRRTGFTAVLVPHTLLTAGLWATLRIALRCPVTVDVTERHDPHQFPRGRRDPRFWRHRWAGLLAARLADGVIVPSRTLERHYTARRVPVLRVPPLIDRAAFIPARPPSLADGPRLLYAGTPGGKDLLDTLVAAVAADPRPVHLVIAGLDRASATTASDLRPETLAAAADRVEFTGKVPHRRILDLLAGSHCSVLLRPAGGYAEAGYPSKVPEALAAGCPMLANLTSDLAETLRDGHNSVVVDGTTPAQIATAVDRIRAMTDRQWQALSEAAAEAAEPFDHRHWSEQLTAFLTGPRQVSQRPAAPALASTVRESQ